MKIARDTNVCLFGEELVSYIYGELPADGSTAFEDHLLSCTDCIEEFAAVSESRLGVYEWHRDEFLPLETPAFSIPYRRPVAVKEPTLSWFGAFRGLFTPARLAVAGGAFAIMAFAFGTIFVVSTPTDQLIANANDSVKPAVASEIPETTISRADNSEELVPNVSPMNEFIADKAGTKPQRSFRPVQARTTKKNLDKQDQAQAARSTDVPQLGNYDETEDTSLRLVDLVADIDTNDF